MGERYLNSLLRGIEINGDEVRPEANAAALPREDLHKAEVGVANREGAVPTFIPGWFPEPGSNQRCVTQH